MVSEPAEYDQIDLALGTIRYRAFGPADSAQPSAHPAQPPVVFVHGFLVDGSLWDAVANRLAEHGVRSYVPDLPLGSHVVPIPLERELAPRTVASALQEFLAQLDLSNVTLVGNDTGGALVQMVVDQSSERVGRVVLTNCDAFRKFPPFPFSAVVAMLRGPARAWFNLQPMRLKFMRHSPLAFGWLAKNLDGAQTKRWMWPALTDAAIRHDLVRFLRSIDKNDLDDVATRLKDFDRPVTLVWGSSAIGFNAKHGHRLADAFTAARFVPVAGSSTFVPLDAPDALVTELLKA